jgi:Zn-dependent protease
MISVIEPQPDRFSDDLRSSLELAQREAAYRHSAYVDVEHLMLGLLRGDGSSARDLLRQHGVNCDTLYDQVADAVGVERPTPIKVKDYSKAARAVLARAAQEAGVYGQPLLSSVHLLLGLMGETNGAVHDALAGIPLGPNDVRAYLRERGTRIPAPANRAVPRTMPRDNPPRSPGGEEPDIVLIPYRPARKRQSASATVSRWGNWPWIAGILALLVAYLVFVLPGNSLFTFIIVLVGWVFSVTLHEFCHAAVAYLGGDHTVKDKGYLSFNPLKYTHPMLSIGLPLLFLALGGIGLPGGAVYIERHRLKNKWWSAAVSAAGPAANLLLAGVLAAPFALGLVKTNLIEFKILFGQTTQSGPIWENATLWSAVAMLAMLQVTAVLFNLLPVPGFDGFGVVEPFLDQSTRYYLLQFGTYGFLLVFLALWFLPPVAHAFWNSVFEVTRALHLPDNLVSQGYTNFMFWRNNPPQ